MTARTARIVECPGSVRRFFFSVSLLVTVAFNVVCAVVFPMNGVQSLQRRKSGKGPHSRCSGVFLERVRRIVRAAGAVSKFESADRTRRVVDRRWNAVLIDQLEFRYVLNFFLGGGVVDVEQVGQALANRVDVHEMVEAGAWEYAA